MTTRLCMSLDLHLTRQNWIRKIIQYNKIDPETEIASITSTGNLAQRSVLRKKIIFSLLKSLVGSIIGLIKD